MQHLKVTVAPTVEVLTLVEAKAHLRVDITDDDDLITELVVAARETCERWLARSFLATTWRLTLDHFPGTYVPGVGRWNQGALGYPGAARDWLERDFPGVLTPIRIPVADLIAVSSLTYVATDGTTTTLDPSAYQVVAGAPGLVVPAYARTWPSARNQPEAVTLDFTAGYGSTVGTVPRYVRAATKLFLSQLYENREATTGLRLEETPLAFRTLMALADWGYRG